VVQRKETLACDETGSETETENRQLEEFSVEFTPLAEDVENKGESATRSEDIDENDVGIGHSGTVLEGPQSEELRIRSTPLSEVEVVEQELSMKEEHNQVEIGQS
jgi:hypothetical protein